MKVFVTFDAAAKITGFAVPTPSTGNGPEVVSVSSGNGTEEESGVHEYEIPENITLEEFVQDTGVGILHKIDLHVSAAHLDLKDVGVKPVVLPGGVAFKKNL